MLCEYLLENFKSRNNGKVVVMMLPSTSFTLRLLVSITKSDETDSGSRSIHAFVDKKTGEFRPQCQSTRKRCSLQYAAGQFPWGNVPSCWLMVLSLPKRWRSLPPFCHCWGFFTLCVIGDLKVTCTSKQSPLSNQLHMKSKNWRSYCRTAFESLKDPCGYWVIWLLSPNHPNFLY